MTMKSWVKFLILLAFLAAVTVAILFFLKYKEPKPAVINANNSQSNISTTPITPKPVNTSSWTEYFNDDLGFSIKIPAEVYGINIGGCIGGSPFKAPLKTLQDGDNVYIFPEYYYEVGDRGYCRKVEYTDDLIKKEALEINQTTGVLPSKLSFGWKITVKNASADDIAEYAKETFGSSCVVDKLSLQDDGNYQIGLKGTDWSTENGYGNCFLDFASKFIYSPAKHKLMSAVLGQECTFYSADPSDVSNYQCYDDAMIDSFKLK